MPRPRTVSGFRDAAREVLTRQTRDYPRYVKACREGQTRGVRIRAQQGACFYCQEAAAQTYDADTLPQLPLGNCAGDGQGFCSCTYVALRNPHVADSSLQPGTKPSTISVEPGDQPSGTAPSGQRTPLERLAGQRTIVYVAALAGLLLLTALSVWLLVNIVNKLTSPVEPEASLSATSAAAPLSPAHRASSPLLGDAGTKARPGYE